MLLLTKLDHICCTWCCKACRCSLWLDARGGQLLLELDQIFEFAKWVAVLIGMRLVRLMMQQKGHERTRQSDKRNDYCDETTYFSMLSPKIIEALTDDVEFVDLASHQ